MPNIKSQKKRVITNNKANEANRAKRSRVRTAIKEYNATLQAGDIAKTEELLKETISLINRAKSDGIYTQNNASRKISRLSMALDKARA